MTPAREKVEEYGTLARRYIDNAHALLLKHEPEKAGQMLWGAAIVSAKAAALSRGHPVTKYQAVSTFVREAAKELGEADLFLTLRALDSFHGRFYEGGVTQDEVDALLGPAGAYVDRFLALAAAGVVMSQ